MVPRFFFASVLSSYNNEIFIQNQIQNSILNASSQGPNICSMRYPNTEVALCTCRGSPSRNHQYLLFVQLLLVLLEPIKNLGCLASGTLQCLCTLAIVQVPHLANLTVYCLTRQSTSSALRLTLAPLVVDF